MATYNIQISNQSGFSKDYVVFQKPPTVVNNGSNVEVYSNAWITFQGLLNGGCDKLQYTDETYAFWGTIPTNSNPMTKVMRCGSALVDTSKLDGVAFSAGPPTGFGAVQAGIAVNSGSFQISAGTDFTAKDKYVFGMAKPTNTGVPGPVATFLATPNDTFDIIPVVKFYVADGSYTPGDVINVKSFSTAPIEIDFTGRSETTATVIQNEYGAFSVSYSS
jgi:hypothetical protein